MRLNEILTEPLLEMSYKKKKAEAVITGLEKPINNHLLKIICVGGQGIVHWREELINWLDEIAEIRLKPDNRPGTPTMYFDILFDEPFGGVEERNIAGRLRRLAREGYAVPANADVGAAITILREFHTHFAVGCAAGRMTEGAIAALVGDIPVATAA